MRAVFYTGGETAWAEVMGCRPWALLPVAGRPLLSYWLELCVDLDIREVQIVLGRNAEHIETFCGSGEKWGLQINYSFIRPGDTPRSYLARDPRRWENGLFYLAGGLFPRRLAGFQKEQLRNLLNGCCLAPEQEAALFVGRDPGVIDRFIERGSCEESKCLESEVSGVDFELIRDVSHYYRLNMEIVRNEMGRYLSGGYATGDGACIGYNVITPPSVALTPPLAIGNDCRIGALSSIGPGSVISDHVLIDRQCELSDCIILSDTYLGRNLEIRGKIVAGSRIIDPEDGTWLDIEDPWLVAPTRPRNYVRDFLRVVISWGLALLLALVQVIPFAVLYGLIRLFGSGRCVRRACWGLNGSRVRIPFFEAARRRPNLLLILFCGGSFDRFPQLLSVLAGRLWLCGQVPEAATEEGPRDPLRYFPAVFSYSDAFVDIDKQMDALYYAHTRSPAADLRILHHALFSRLVEVESAAGSAPAEELSA